MTDNDTLQRAIVRSDASIRTVMARLDRNRIKLGLVLDEGGRLLRTVTDGDIRRALLGGALLDDAISCLPPQRAVTVPEKTAPAQLLQEMDRHGVNALVVTDAAGEPVDLVDRGMLSGAILLSPPHMGGGEAAHVQQAFDDNWVAPAGPNLDAFEKRLAVLSTREHAVAVSSGTAGLHLAMRALNLPRGARVYVSDLTFVGSVQPLLYERLEPALIDAEPGTWNMSPGALRRQIEADAASDRKGAAILLVHLYGQSANVGEILTIAEEHGLPLVEDAAESLGAVYDNRPSGAHGVISVYSFNGNKIITTSSGGALVTDDPKIAERARYLATQGRDPVEHYQHSTIAYNYRMSNILAGVGLGQLDVLSDRVAARRAIFERYKAGLSDLPGIAFQEDSPRSLGNRWLTSIEFDPNRLAIHPYQIMRKLRQGGIETRPGWKPLHMQPLCHGFAFAPHSEKVTVSAAHFQRALCLPTGSNLTVAEQDRIIAAVRSILTENLV
ncbi:DegT/DnrJ/EryC1/StrS family aminotransferase [Pelagerythrobacter marinus]|uniref:DegT/DnrJ/EryC1/StrS family aminotransferase n=1 Tax=Pelagerythrobacter marinus TaxID=538382 RepID=UPI002036C4F6|nr:DegT/DnrJ/EryC1/StrS family aminotransferase [Pelagerythrobacter marinus]USA39123.1 DegT/DnrJ/EryC1/StrS family aminotransferase [Pelagerythrobacter marinus]WPZ06790.1 DegT/DnrJ/EryC1/StrS family aminotransferase [Pelagerythrobacter marinus]